MGVKTMKLNAPTKVVFFVSLALALLSLLGQFGVLSFLPGFWLALAAYSVLALACVLKNL